MYTNRRCRTDQLSPYPPCYDSYYYDYDDAWNWSDKPSDKPSESRAPISFFLDTKKIFQDFEHPTLYRKHSDGRLKTYNSAVNVSWSIGSEERRQHILQLVKHEFGSLSSLGKIVPLETLVEFLLADSNAMIKQLQDEIQRLKDQLKKNKSSSSNLEVVDGPRKTLELPLNATPPGEEKENLLQAEEDPTKELEGAPRGLGNVLGERDKLVDDLLKMQKDYEELKKKCKDPDKPLGPCVDQRTYRNLENKYNELKSQLKHSVELGDENELLLEKIEECESIISKQADEIKKLSCHINCLTQNRFKVSGKQFQHHPLPEVCYSGEGLPPVCPKIAEAENFLQQLDRNQTKEQIHALQYAVDALTSELEIEKQKNNTLVRRYTNQCQVVSNMKNEISEVKRRSYKDKRKLFQLNMTLRDILERSSGSIRSCICLEVIHPKPASPHTISNFKGKPSLQVIECPCPQESKSKEYNFNWIVKKGKSSSNTDSSFDSFSSPE